MDFSLRSQYASTIISNHWLLTLAEPLKTNERARAFAGIVDRSNIIEAEYSSGEIYNNSFVPHPQFDTKDTFKYNIGLIHLCRPIIFSINIQPAKLPFSLRLREEIKWTEMKGTVIGFGDLLGGKIIFFKVFLRIKRYFFSLHTAGSKSMFMFYYKEPILDTEVCKQKLGDKFDKDHHKCVKSKHATGQCWE